MGKEMERVAAEVTAFKAIVVQHFDLKDSHSNY